MALHGSNIIGGRPASPVGKAFRAVDPVRRVQLEPAYHEASESDVNAAFEAARQAFESYGSTMGVQRARFLRAIADELMTIGAELLERASAESALPMARLEGERGRTIGQLRMFADLVEEGSWVDARIDTPDAARAPLPKPDLRRMLVPLGPVAVFGASNFPLAFSVPGGDTASALAAGCTVVCKGHPAHPGTSELCAGAIARAAVSTGIHAGVFSLLHGWAHDVGIAMVKHPFTQAVGFTGSLRGGRALFDVAAARPVPIPVYGEMGSVNPVFVLPGAMAERSDAIAKSLAQSITVGVGQFCTNPGIVVGLEGEALTTMTNAVSGHLSAAPHATMLYEQLSTGFDKSVERATQHGAVRAFGKSSPVNGSVAPTLLTATSDEFVQRPELREEMFGPVSIVVTARDSGDLLRVARAMEGQLTATIHGTEAELTEHRELIAELQRKVGRLLFNQYPTGVEVGTAMQHGGPYPASTDSRTTSVGTAAIDRFARPVCFQNFPETALPLELHASNPNKLWRMIDGVRTQAAFRR